MYALVRCFSSCLILWGKESVTFLSLILLMLDIVVSEHADCCNDAEYCLSD